MKLLFLRRSRFLVNTVLAPTLPTMKFVNLVALPCPLLIDIEKEVSMKFRNKMNWILGGAVFGLVILLSFVSWRNNDLRSLPFQPPDATPASSVLPADVKRFPLYKWVDEDSFCYSTYDDGKYLTCVPRLKEK